MQQTTESPKTVKRSTHGCVAGRGCVLAHVFPHHTEQADRSKSQQQTRFNYFPNGWCAVNKIGWFIHKNLVTYEFRLGLGDDDDAMGERSGGARCFADVVSRDDA